MSWNWTKSGHLCRTAAINAGFGRQYVGGPNKLPPPVVGDRSAKTCQRLWALTPESYRRCHTYSDFWAAYAKVFDEETHRCVGKEIGETAHMERWNNTLRQRLARYVRETLSFSKSDFWHQIVTEMFIITYNLSCIT
jgi:insertion element IS1 protein InsB